MRSAVLLPLLLLLLVSSVIAAGKRDPTKKASEQQSDEIQLDSTVVTDLTLKQLSLVVQDPNWAILVMFSKMTSESSKSVWPAYKAAAEALQGVVPAAHFNCLKKAHHDVCENYCNKGYPKVLLFPAGGNRKPILYWYDMRADLLVDFALGNLDTYVANVDNVDWKPFLRKTAVFPRILHLTTDNWLDPALNTIAFQHRLRSAVGQIRHPSAEILAHYGLTNDSLPTAIAYPHGEANRFELFGKKTTPGAWADFGDFVNKVTLPEVRDKKVAPLAFHEAFSSPRPVSAVERLNATKFDKEVYEIANTRTVVLFVHSWMTTCRKLMAIYEDVPRLLEHDDIEVGILDLDVDGGNEARAVQARFSFHELPSIVYFAGKSEPPYKMDTLARQVDDAPVTAEEIAEWARSTDIYASDKIKEDSRAKKAEEERKEKIRQERIAKNLPPEDKVADVIMNLEDEEGEEGAHYTLDIDKVTGKVLKQERTDL